MAARVQPEANLQIRMSHPLLVPLLWLRCLTGRHLEHSRLEPKRLLALSVSLACLPQKKLYGWGYLVTVSEVSELEWAGLLRNVT